MRLFVAISPDPLTRAALARSAAQVRQHGLPGARVVSDAKLHITLDFLGKVEEERLDALKAAYQEVARAFSPLSIELHGAGGFPSTARAKVIWIGVRAGDAALGTLASRVREASAACGLPPEARSFHPHLTLAYTKQAADVRALAQALESTQAPVSLTARELVLMRSHGDAYEAIGTFPLARDLASER
jgi:2'-5' RNA ligase